MKRIIFQWFIATTCMLSVCTSCHRSNKQDPHQALYAKYPVDSTLVLEDAKGFSVEYSGANKIITVYDPWSKGAVFATYVVSRIPPNRVVLTATPQVGLLERLGCLDQVVGMTDATKLCNEPLKQAFEQGKIVDVGGSMSLNVERVILTHPDLVFKSAFEGGRDQNSLLSAAHITEVYTAAWMESSPLARLEWIKFYAAFFNKEQVADSIFQSTKQEYKALVYQSQHSGDTLQIVSGLPYSGVWYMPGGNSFKAKYFADAGIDYYWKIKKQEGSLPLSVEEVVAKQGSADFWIDVPVKNKKELLGIDERFGIMRAVKKNQVYAHDRRSNALGGDEYWETSMAYPERVLNDLVHIFHPNLNPHYELYYYRKLN